MIRKTSLSILMVFLAGGLLLFAAACAPKVTKVEGAEKDQVLSWSEPMADNLFAALNSGDYTAFSTDLDSAMKTAMPESGLQSLEKTLTKVGKWQSRSVDHVEKTPGYYVVVYNAKFEQDNVTVRLTFTQAEPHKVSGLWLTSPKLAK